MAQMPEVEIKISVVYSFVAGKLAVYDGLVFFTITSKCLVASCSFLCAKTSIVAFCMNPSVWPQLTSLSCR